MADEVEARVVSAMKQLGFTATDAKTYIALLRGHPATGYELAARSSVPRSAIYGVLRRLASLGLVNSIDDKPTRYVPLSPDRLVELLESRTARQIDGVREALKGVAHPATDVATWTVLGYSQLLEQATRLIDRSHERVCASLWRREAQRLARPLRAASARGVEVILFSWNPLPENLGQVLSYGIDESQLENYWPHKLVLVADDEQVLVGEATETEENRAVVSEERPLVEMAVANVVLDITLLGQRHSVETEELVTRLTSHLAPVETLAP